MEKILIILTPGFPASETDSTCLPLQQQVVLALNRLFPSLTIKILSFQYPAIAKTYYWFENEVISFGGRNRGNFRRLWLRRKVQAHLNQIYSLNQIHGIFSFWFGECALVGKEFADRNNLKHYCWLLGQDARLTNPYPKRVSLDGRELVALSDFLQNEYERNHKVKPHRVIEAGVPGRSYSVTSKKRDIDLLAVGSLISLKNYDAFIEVVAAIRKMIPGVKAVIVGGGPEKAQLQYKIGLSGLQSNIKMTGELPYVHVLEHMERAKVFLHPSSYEGFSGVCLEAVSLGAHVISFCKPMNTEIRNWTVVNNPEQMLNKSLAILLNPCMEFTSQVEYHIDETAKKIVSLFA